MKYLEGMWHFIAIGFIGLYYICRYGMEGANKKLDEELASIKSEHEQLLEGLRLGEDR